MSRYTADVLNITGAVGLPDPTIGSNAATSQVWGIDLNNFALAVDGEFALKRSGNPNGFVASNYVGRRLYDSTNNKVWTCTTLGTALTAVWADFILTPLAAYTSFIETPTSEPALPVGLTITLPAVTGWLNGQRIIYPAIALTAAANKVNDYQGASDGTVVTQTVDVASYNTLLVYKDHLHLWQVQSNGSAITSIHLMSNFHPVPKRTDDKFLTMDDFIDQMWLDTTTTNWVATTAVVFRQLLVTTTGKVYRVIVPGTTGSSAPTSTASGNITDGGATLQFYCMSWYLGMFRYAQNNGLDQYFSNIGCMQALHRIDSGGIEMTTRVKSYLQGLMKHVTHSRQNSATYQAGMKIFVAGFYWRANSVGGATAGSSPFTSGYSVGSTVTDGGVVWQAVYAYFGAADWTWLRVDSTFNTYNFPDSHDSYAATFIRLAAHYDMMTNGTDRAWWTTASPQPGLTYKQVLTNIYLANLSNNIDLVTTFMTGTFQGNIAPWDGSSFTTRYFEDNSESFSGCAKGHRDPVSGTVSFTAEDGASYMFDQVLGDPTNRDNALYIAGFMDSGNYNLFNATNGIAAYYYGQDTNTFVNDATLGFYAAMQAQLFADLHDLPSYSYAMRRTMRQWLWKAWPNWIADRGRDTGPSAFCGYIAAKIWGDSVKAQEVVTNVEEYFTTGGAMVIDQFAYYLDIKDILAPPFRVLKKLNKGVLIEDNRRIITALGSSRANRIITAAGAVTMTSADNIIEVAQTVPAACTVNAPAAPVLWDIQTVKDGAGNASAYPVTLVGTFDGVVNPSFNTDWFSRSFYWNGTQFRFTA